MVPTNEQIAQALDQVGELLAGQDAKSFRATAYHRGATVVRSLGEPVAALFGRGGLDALMQLTGIGPSLARAIAELVETGRLGLLERLQGQSDPETVLATVPGIGRTLARRIHERLGVDTLEELEVAAHDGRLDAVPGFGARRLRGVVESLAARLGMRARRAAAPDGGPSVAELLDVDSEYRLKARAGALRRIAPRRFNPEGRAWLPILHTERGTRHYTALFSNTARAHDLGKTDDWVIVYIDDGGRERQVTVVTETHGPLQGRRVVRGHERECVRLYGSAPGAPDPFRPGDRCDYTGSASARRQARRRSSDGVTGTALS